MSELACINRQPTRAATLLGASEKLREITSTPLPQIRREEYERTVASVLAQLDEVKFKEAWGKGWEMLVDQAVSYAISDY